MEKNRYKKSDLDVHVYGTGRNKTFIIYTDFERIEDSGPRWNTIVYPDIAGNRAKAIKQTLKWLNNMEVPEPWIKKNPTKVFIGYSGPQNFYETDARGCDISRIEDVLLY